MRAESVLGGCLLLLLLAGCSWNEYNQYLEQGKEALENNEYQEAVSYFERAVKEKNEEEAQLLLEESKIKQEIDSLIEKGKKALADKKINEAITILTDILKQYENEEEVKINGLVEETKKLLTEATQQKEDSLMQISENAVKGKEYEIAKKKLTELLELNQENERAKQLMSFCENMINGTKALHDEKYDEAISLFTIALNAQPNNENAQQLKEDALNAKRESETVVATTHDTDADFNVNEGNATTSLDQGSVQFVNAMVGLMNHYQQNVTNQLQGISTGMTTPAALILAVEHNYRESLNVYVPYPDYQVILDNWLLCLESTHGYLQMLKDITNGDFSSATNDVNIQNMVNYYDLAQNGLNAIQ